MKMTLKSLTLLCVAATCALGCLTARNPAMKKMAEVNIEFRDAQGNAVMNMAPTKRRGGNWTTQEIEGGLNGDDDHDTKYSMNIKAPAGAVQDILQSWKYVWNEDGSGEIMFDTNSIIDTTVQANMLQATTIAQMQTAERIAQIVANGVITGIEKYFTGRAATMPQSALPLPRPPVALVPGTP